MLQIESFLEKNPGKAFFALLALAFPAFLINLGLLPLFADEPTRANVALEMVLTGNYAVPTVGGEYYYNKPPFYNWMLAGLYHVTGSYTELVTRMPAFIPLFLFSITIYFTVGYFLKDKRIAALSGLLLLVNGRMLIYDSMLGHIDLFYSWLTYVSFMLIFYFYQEKKWFWLFFASYIITAVTFLCKGLPSIVFQGFTLIALLTYTKNFRKLFSWQHINCGLICLLIIGAYFYNYSSYNPDLEGYFSTIWDQSSQRTAASTGFWKSATHIVLFPFEHLGHLFPASLLVLFCLHRGFWKGLMQKASLKYIVIIFLANIWVYWLSPQTRPRYLLMLYPLVFIVWGHAYYTWRHQLPKINRIVNILFLTLAILVTVLVPAAFFAGLNEIVSFLYLKVIIVFALSALFSWLIYRLQRQKIMAFIGLLLVVRLAFSWFVLPHRLHHNQDAYYRASAIEMGRISSGKDFYFYQYHPAPEDIPFHDRLIFYIQRTRLQQVKFIENAVKPGYYFTFDRELKSPNSVLIKSYQSNLKLYQVK